MNETQDWRRDRKSRKRGFDDDQAQGGGWSPPEMPAFAGVAPSRRSSAPASLGSTSAGPELLGVVKRFDAERGFGFIAVEGGAGDAFLHVSVLQRAGADTVSPGARLRVRVGQGERGHQVTEVLEIGGAGDAPQSSSRRPAPQTSRAMPQVGDGEDIRGTVKWYSAEKGFGFVTPNGGGKDVFVHATALERSGAPALADGQAVILRVVQGKKGLEAASISLV